MALAFPTCPAAFRPAIRSEEAVANGAQTLAGHFAAMRADGEAIPAPRSFEQLKRDPEFADDSADAIVKMVNPRDAMAAAE